MVLHALSGAAGAAGSARPPARGFSNSGSSDSAARHTAATAGESLKLRCISFHFSFHYLRFPRISFHVILFHAAPQAQRVELEVEVEMEADAAVG